MVKKSLFLLLCLFSFAMLYAQDDHLEPKLWQTYGFSHYDSLVGARFGEHSELRFMEVPSWYYITAFSLEKEPDGYYLKINQIEYIGRGASDPEFHHFKVSSLFAVSLKSLFEESISQVDFPVGDTQGLDGTEYYFAVRKEDGRMGIGTKWSPADSTLTGQLIILCNRIAETKKSSDLPDIAVFMDLTNAMKEYKEKYAGQPKVYKNRGIWDLEGERYASNEKIDTPPSFLGGNFTEYASCNLVYPDSLLQTDTWGEAFCSLWIDSTGYVTNEQIHASHPLFESAAKQVLEGARHWEPAGKDGNPVECGVTVYITFNPETYRRRMK